MLQQDPELVQKSSSGILRSTKARTLAQGRGMAGEEALGLDGGDVFVALWIDMKIHVG